MNKHSCVCINNCLQNYNFCEIYASILCENIIFAVKKIDFSRKICALLAFFSRITRLEACTLHRSKCGIGYKKSDTLFVLITMGLSAKKAYFGIFLHKNLPMSAKNSTFAANLLNNLPQNGIYIC